MNPPVAPNQIPEAKPMTPEQSLEFFRTICRPISAPAQFHDQVRICLDSLAKAISDKKSK
jgi:hypothetical protein